MLFNHGFQGKVIGDIGVLEYLNEVGLIVDVGAGYGGHILKYLDYVGPNNIYAFEPLPHNIDILRENVNADINLFPFACGDRDKIVRFEIPDVTPIKGRRDRDGIRADYIGIGRVKDQNTPKNILLWFWRYFFRRGKSARKLRTIKVRQVRFDSILPLKRISLLKIDVQGYEEKVLRGLGNRLQDIEIIYIEYSPFRKGAVIFLQENGFDIFDNKYIIFGPPNKEQYLRDRGFTNIFGFRNSTGKYRYDCSLSEDLFDIDLFTYSLGNGFRVNETDLICMNNKFNLQDRLLDSIKD